MFKLKFMYTASITDHFLQDALAHAASVQLLSSHGIDCAQSSAAELVFDTETDRCVASPALSASTEYCVVYGAD